MHMSMSEFEKQPVEQEGSLASCSVRGHPIPTDFSEEDLAFAKELDALFALDEEEIPPYFAQTLLEPNDPRFQVVEPGFEHKIRARVFHRLKLRRRLFHSPRLEGGRGSVSGRRSLLTLVAAVMLFFMLTVAFTGQSFAQGMAVLLHSKQSGVYQVRGYPKGIVPFSYSFNDPSPQRQISLPMAQGLLHFPMYWPQTTPTSYLLDGIYLYEQTGQSWADGPMLELHYDYTSAGTPRSIGEIAIREFKPKAKTNVLQVVEADAAHGIQVDAKGLAQAIYVDGRWVSLNKYSHRWVYGGRSELIYEQDGVVFWIVGDQRDGITQDVLWTIAQSLQAINVSHIERMGVELTYVTQIVDEIGR